MEKSILNIFFLHEDPVISARWLIDRHVANGKMIVESSQMLANCYLPSQLNRDDCPKTQKGESRTYGYYNHCCSKWIRESLSNFNWLLEHAQEMGRARMYRTGKDHFSIKFINWCANNTPNIKDIGLTKPAMAFNNCDQFKDENNITLSYKKFYVFDKRFDKKGNKMDFYTKRERPKFWEELSYLLDKIA